LRDVSPTNIQNGVLWPFNPSLGVYHCPADRSLTRDGSQTRLRSYSLLNYLGAPPDDDTRDIQRGSQLRHPSTVFAFACEDSDSINDGILFIFAPPTSQWKDLPAWRHSHGDTLSFADGHVEYWYWKSQDAPNDQEDLTRVQAALPDP
jgi:prepilin-type processing-associated H-X9-DG protein